LFHNLFFVINLEQNRSKQNVDKLFCNLILSLLVIIIVLQVIVLSMLSIVATEFH